MPEPPDTSWTLIHAAAAGPGSPEGRDAMAKFQLLYSSAVRAMIGNKVRGTNADPDDVTSGFFLDQMWDGKLLQSAEARDNKQFRYFLRRSVSNYVSDSVFRKRDRITELKYTQQDMEDTLSADRAFDIAWAGGLVNRAVTSVLESLDREGEGFHAECFRQRFLGPNTRMPTWEAIANQLRKSFAELRTADAPVRRVRTATETVVARIKRQLVAELTEQTGSEQGAHRELRSLWLILSSESPGAVKRVLGELAESDDIEPDLVSQCHGTRDLFAELKEAGVDSPLLTRAALFLGHDEPADRDDEGQALKTAIRQAHDQAADGSRLSVMLLYHAVIAQAFYLSGGWLSSRNVEATISEYRDLALVANDPFLQKVFGRIIEQTHESTP